MLKLEYLTIRDEKGHYLLKDASFVMSNLGFVSIHGDTCELHHALAQILSGIRKPDGGTLTYNDCEIHEFKEEERALYRSTFVSSLFHDFQILKDRSVYDNIAMGLEYPQERIDEELRIWKLADKRDVAAEDLTTQEQWMMVLLRCVLRQPMMLVLDTESCPLSKQELQSLYALLEQLKNRMLIIVIGDMGSYAFSDRIIEIEKGYLLSDSLHTVNMFPQINQSTEQFQLTRTGIEQLHEKIHGFIRWKLRCASLLCVAAFICLSTAVFSTTLNIIDIQLRLMQKQGSSIVAIEKQAFANDDSIIDNYYDHLNDQDVKELKRQLKGDLILGYYPADTKKARLDTYGSGEKQERDDTLDAYTIIEADSEKEIGLNKIYGTYPTSYTEVALSSSQAYQLLSHVLEEPYQNTEEQIKKMLNATVMWYGYPMIITGIFPSQDDANTNLELDMAGYNGSTYTSGSMMENSFFVKKGFTNAYPVLMSKAYEKSDKRLIYGSRNVVSFDGLRSLDTNVYYYSGSDYRNDHDLKEDEVLIDYPMALDMGFRSAYMGALDGSLLDYEQLQNDFHAFANTWIGRTITIQTYSISNAPSSTTIMNKKVKIKGFMLPISFSYNDYKRHYANAEGAGSVYTNPALTAPYETHNRYIKEAFYHSDDEADMRNALSYLNSQNTYGAYLMNSRILKFFVVDLKEITSFLMIAGTLSFVSYIAIMIFLLISSIHYMRSEYSIFYLFGEQKSAIRRIVMQYFNMVTWMRTLFGWFCGTLALGTFILMIYFTLSASKAILWSLILPLMLLLLCIVIMKIAYGLCMRNISVIEEEFHDEI